MQFVLTATSKDYYCPVSGSKELQALKRLGVKMKSTVSGLPGTAEGESVTTTIEESVVEIRSLRSLVALVRRLGCPVILDFDDFGGDGSLTLEVYNDNRE